MRLERRYGEGGNEAFVALDPLAGAANRNRFWGAGTMDWMNGIMGRVHRLVLNLAIDGTVPLEFRFPDSAFSRRATRASATFDDGLVVAGNATPALPSLGFVHA